MVHPTSNRQMIGTVVCWCRVNNKRILLVKVMVESYQITNSKLHVQALFTKVKYSVPAGLQSWKTMLQSWFPFLGQLANTYIVSHPHASCKAGDSTTCSTTTCRSWTCCSTRGQEVSSTGAYRVDPEKWFSNWNTWTMSSNIVAMRNSHHLHNTPHSPVMWASYQTLVDVIVLLCIWYVCAVKMCCGDI